MKLLSSPTLRNTFLFVIRSIQFILRSLLYSTTFQIQVISCLQSSLLCFSYCYKVLRSNRSWFIFIFIFIFLEVSSPSFPWMHLSLHITIFPKYLYSWTTSSVAISLRLQTKILVVFNLFMFILYSFLNTIFLSLKYFVNPLHSLTLLILQCHLWV